jgi:hypothetical protein
MIEMEDWEIDFQWLEVQHIMSKAMKLERLPDMNGTLFLVGMQELGRWQAKWTKEEKQDLMHIAICRLLSEEGHYKFDGRDADGWPHYTLIHPIHVTGPENQEQYLKQLAIKYIKELAEENGWISDPEKDPSLA